MGLSLNFQPATLAMQSISGTTETATSDDFMGNIKCLSNSSSLLDEESEGDEVVPITYIF